ncbi:MAG: hypothetical protein ACKVS9_02140 [Phycisphaerae bacterium]
MLGLATLVPIGCGDPVNLELRLRPVVEGCQREVWVELRERGSLVEKLRLTSPTAGEFANADTSRPPLEFERAYLTYFGLRDSIYSIRLVEGDRDFVLKIGRPNAGTGGIQYRLFLAIPRDIRQAWCTAELRGE